jgi:single-strand DNA-binding protein
MNSVNMIGRITRDPESRTTPSQVVVTTFSIAVDRKFKVNGEKVADFFNVVAWRQTGEFVAKYLKKGMKIAVVGELQTRNYDDKDGKKVYLTEIIASDVEGLEKREKDSQPSNNQTMDDDDDDTSLPFDL